MNMKQYNKPVTESLQLQNDLCVSFGIAATSAPVGGNVIGGGGSGIGEHEIL